MNLEKIDVICVKTLERSIDLIEDCGAGETVLVLIVFGDFKLGFVVDVSSGCTMSVWTRALVMSEVGRTRLFANGPAAFCQDEDLMTGNVELLQCFADNFFGDAIAVSIGGIPGIETTIIRRLEKLQCLSRVSTRLD